MEIVLLIVLGVVAWRFSASLRSLERRIGSAEDAAAALRGEVQALRDQLAAVRRTEGEPAPEAPASEAAPTQPTAEAPPSVAAEQVPETEQPHVPRIAASSPSEGPAGPPSGTLEERLGTRWSVWVGGLALALGGLLLVRYTIEQGLIGPETRIALGAMLAIALAAAGEWLRRRERAVPVPPIAAAHIPSILTGAGTVVAFGTAYAAHALYGFIGPAAAFVLLGAIGIGALLAAALHGPALAGVGLAGALVAPLLVSTPDPNPWPVVTYLVAVAAAAYALARLRRWLWLGAATVAGIVAWGFALVIPQLAGGVYDWTTAAMAHTFVQLVLAAIFMGVEPSLGVSDEGAAPDWIAASALTAITVLALAVLLDVATGNTSFVPFAVASAAVLAATGLWSAPAAAAAVLAGVVVLGMMLAWPALGTAPAESATPTPPYTFEPGEVLRLPADVTGFLGLAALAMLGVAGASGLRLLRGTRLPVPTAGLYAAAATVPPLLGMVLAYLRVTQFDRSIPFALGGAALALIFAFAAELFHRADRSIPSPAARLAAGAFAAAAIAALSFALVASLERGYLTVAFALTAAGVAFVGTLRDIPLLRYAVAVLGVVVLARVAIDPRIMGASVGTWPIINWLLVGYGVPALSFALAAELLRLRGDDLAVRLCDGLAVLFAALLAFYEIRHYVNGGDVLRPASGHVEQGLLALTSLGFAYVLTRLDLARANPVFHVASLGFGVIAALLAAIGLGLSENPLFTREPVAGGAVLSSLLVAYLLPGLMAVLVARLTRDVRPDWYVTGASALAVLLIFGYVTLEVRHIWQGPLIGLLRTTGGAEHWTYSVAWLAMGLVFLAYGLWRGSKEARLASAALVVLSVVKVFLFDLSGLEGLWRALSFISLGLVLIGIGLVYQRVLFARPASEPAAGGGG
jgi:uncharacterized membrane protein